MTETIASQCGGDGQATFANFRRNGFRDLFVVTTNISTHKVVIFCADTTPDVAVVDALLMSQSVPLFFEAPQFDGKNLGTGDYYGNGGMLNNYPLDIFDEPNYAANNRWFIGGVNWETLGCHLYTPDDKPDLRR
ncbi:patatin-like phospholipase family protein [Chloroflexi bacterium TSY]|nr:patatin-like phospholipase family protein [Chloroflexi bacterium TSY]